MKQATSDKTISLLLIIIIIPLFLTACTTSHTDMMTPKDINLPDSFTQTNYIEFELNNIDTTAGTYNYTIKKPTPCSGVLTYQTYNTAEDRVELHSFVGEVQSNETRLCAEVITPETITGTINRSITNYAIIVNGDLVHEN